MRGAILQNALKRVTLLKKLLKFQEVQLHTQSCSRSTTLDMCWKDKMYLSSSAASSALGLDAVGTRFPSPRIVLGTDDIGG